MSVPISARHDGANFVHAVGPDVCKTPIGSSMVPVPYMSISFFDPAIRTSRSVRNNGKKDYQLNTRSSVTYGHEPGVGKGVSVPGYMKYSFARHGSKTVFSEGWAVIRDGDPGYMNKPSPGKTQQIHKRFKTPITHI